MATPTHRRRIAVGVVLVAGLYTLGALLTFWYVGTPEDGVAFFPAAGVTLAALALTPKRTWPLWLGTVALCELGVDLTHGQPVLLAIGFVLANTVEPFVGATLLRARIGGPTSSAARRELREFLLCAVVAGPVIGAVIGASTAIAVDHTAAGEWALVAGRWWVGDALGVLVVATPIIAAYRRTRFDGEASRLEIAGLVAAVVLLVVVPAIVWDHPVLFVATPVLLWAAIRGGMRAVGATGLALTLAADWVAVTGHMSKLVAAGTPLQQLLYVQISLGLTLVMAMVVAVEVAERRRVEHRAHRAEAERLRAEVQAMAQAQEERATVARETHDIVGHGLNVILLQVGAARRMLDSDSGKVEALLESIERVGRDACDDLDTALASAWDGDARNRRGVADVPALVDALRDAGLDIQLVVEGQVRPLPNVVDWAGYRIVQEALTNVGKHAPRSRAVARVVYDVDALRVSVIDDGDGDGVVSPVDRLDGFGVAGMRKRVASLSGRLIAAPRQEGGFRVEAVIPTDLTPPSDAAPVRSAC